LLALPIASIGRNSPIDHGPQPGTNRSKLLDVEDGLGMAIAFKAIGGALVAVLISVGLVGLSGPAKDPQIVPHCHLEGG
jgi:hypothetical protein